MEIGKDEKKCIKEACLKYKAYIQQPDVDRYFLKKYSEDDFYNVIENNIDDFRTFVLQHDMLEKYGYKSLKDAYEMSYGLFMWCLQEFIHSRLGLSYTPIKLDNPITSTTNAVINTVKDEQDEEKENKKEFIKEVMDGIEPKKYLKEFLDDPRSYKQFQKDIREAILYIDFEKIHRAMKKLGWNWACWEDDMGEPHYDEVPTVYALREEVIRQLDEIERHINTHPEDNCYFLSTGGFEYDIHVCAHENDEPDDYEHRVRLIVRFVLEQYNNGM